MEFRRTLSVHIFQMGQLTYRGTRPDTTGRFLTELLADFFSSKPEDFVRFTVPPGSSDVPAEDALEYSDSAGQPLRPQAQDPRPALLLDTGPSESTSRLLAVRSYQHARCRCGLVRRPGATEPAAVGHKYLELDCSQLQGHQPKYSAQL